MANPKLKIIKSFCNYRGVFHKFISYLFFNKSTRVRLKANALFIVIIISLVMGLICSSLVFLAYYSRKQISDNLLREKLIRNTESAINILCTNNDQQYENPQTIDLFDQGTDTVVMVKKSWGIFEVASVKAVSKSHVAAHSVLLGYKPDKISNAAIWLTDNNRSLSLAGSTTITGNCYLPERGVERVYIEGKGVFAKNLVEGKIQKSNTQIPALNEKIKSLILSSLKGSFRDVKTLDFSTAFTDSAVIANSFSNQTLVLTDQQNRLSIQHKISGNMIIASSGKVIIKRNANLNDIQIYAASIIVESGFTGTVQLFAEDSIVIEKGVNLRYPSVACLIKTNPKNFQPYISLETGSVLSGLIILDQTIEDRTKTRLEIQKDALLRGQAYVNGFADIKGKIYGNIICDKFLLRTSSSIYENHLMDAEINRNKLNKAFIGSAILDSKKQKGIIKFISDNE